jgi:hypothetical protein
LGHYFNLNAPVEFRTFGFDDTATSPSAGANPHSPGSTCCSICSLNSVSYYTTGVGTHTYSSPEQVTLLPVMVNNNRATTNFIMKNLTSIRWG